MKFSENSQQSGVVMCGQIEVLTIVKKTVNGVLHDVIHKIHNRHYLLPNILILPQHTCKCNFIYSHKKYTALPVHSFTKSQLHLQLTYTGLQQIKTTEMGNSFLAFSVLPFVKIGHLIIFVILSGFNFTIIGQKCSKYGKKSTYTL